MENGNDEIREHYNKIKEIGISKRTELSTINIRNMNNFIKSILINENVKEGDSVLDIGCGKGGDLRKYDHLNINEYFGVDISDVSIENAIIRHKNSSIRYRAKFIVADAYNSILDNYKKYDIISIQFSFHYAFSKIESVETAVLNIKNALAPNGKLILTVPSQNALLRRYKKYGNGFGNDFYKVTFEKSFDEIVAQENMIGVEYKFTLKDSIDNCIEYLIDHRILSDLFKKNGLKVVEYSDFLQYFNKHVKQYLALHDRIVREKLNMEEIRVCELYDVIVVEKVIDI